MSQISPQLRSLEGGRLAFWCPGCMQAHQISHGPGGWNWNGNTENPTFSPSVLVRGNKLVTDESGRWTGDWILDENRKPIPFVCHSLVTDGRIQFLGDCTHELAGQTVDLPPWPGNH